MQRSRWLWRSVLGALAVVAVTAFVAPRAARSDDESETLAVSSDVAALHAAIDNWDDDETRESCLAEYLGAGSREALFASVDDPSAFAAR